ncbi:calcineurin B homologous protein 1-like isoform X3 [Oncorhynchus nerka]|uniref:calcineurin B homologous protein 1-like isoform X3 n=1 Tax=Oncorhynchus nerka TaxID=8023 RepID=UPI0031B81343
MIWCAAVLPNTNTNSMNRWFSCFLFNIVTPAHIVRLYDRFEALDKEKTGHLRPQDFGAINRLAMNPIGDRIIGAFFSPGQETVDFHSFVRILAHFRPADKKRPKDPSMPEPVNSRTSKLKYPPWFSPSFQLPSNYMTKIKMEKSPELSFYRCCGPCWRCR